MAIQYIPVPPLLFYHLGKKEWAVIRDHNAFIRALGIIDLVLFVLADLSYLLQGEWIDVIAPTYGNLENHNIYSFSNKNLAPFKARFYS
jgi:hypothetical protein